MGISEKVCLACGFCCDGTVIGFVELQDKEPTQLKDLLEVELLQGQGLFLEPCKQFCDGCNIYNQRPKKCQEYNCNLLHSIADKKIDFESSIQVINQVKDIKKTIQDQLTTLPFQLKSDSFYFKIKELKKELNKIEPDSKKRTIYQDLSEEIQKLDHLLHHNFGVSF